MAKKKAAELSEMNSLHEEFAKELRRRLKEGEEVTIGGETKKVPASAAFLNVVRGFLKDNRIECTTNITAPVQDVASALEDFENAAYDEDEAPHFN